MSRRGLELGDLALLGVQAQHRFVDRAVEPDDADRLGPGLQLGVEVGGDVVRLPEHLLGDPPGPPRLHVPGDDASPDPWQPVGEDQCVTDQGLAADGRHRQRGSEGGRGVPAQRGQPLPLQVVGIWPDCAGDPVEEGLRAAVRCRGLDRVPLRPLHRERQDLDLGAVAQAPGVTDLAEQVRRGERCGGHGGISYRTSVR